jgi:hypothetical protein
MRLPGFPVHFFIWHLLSFICMKISFSVNSLKIDTFLPFQSNVISIAGMLEAEAHWDFELYSSSNHISPLLNCPQGYQGCQKNQKDLRITTMIRFCASFQPKLNELHKNLQNQQKSSKYASFFGDFSNFLHLWLKTSAKTDHGCDP